MIETSEDLYERVIAVWDDSGMTDAEIAAVSGVPLQNLYRYRRDHGKNPSWFLVARTVEACGASLDSLVDNPYAGTVSEPSADTHHTAYVEARYRECRRERLLWQKRSFVLVIVVALLALTISAVVVYDLLHPSAGWIQYATQVTAGAFEQTSAHIHTLLSSVK